MDNDSVKELQAICRKIDSVFLEESGGVLYSSAETLRQGDLFILGLNPGGSGGPSIKDSIENMPKEQENHYLRPWNKYAPGEHPLQKNIRQIAACLGESNIKNVCATNLIFRQTKQATDLEFIKDADTCWPAINKMISIVKPKVIVCFGNGKISPFVYLKEKIGSGSQIIFEKSGHGNWNIKHFRSDNGGYVLGLPHLSRYKPSKEAMAYIKKTFPM